MKNTDKIKNALWGLFISDSISMPVHWYYKRKYIKNEFGVIDGYNKASHPHPESFMVGNTYFPNLDVAKKLGRPFDILHEHINFYNTSYSDLKINLQTHDGEHKNPMPLLDERYHYHHGLEAGENTLGANLVRVLLRSIIKNGEYSQDSFLDDFILYMTTAGQNKDAYSEIYIRDWFENYTKGIAPDLCANSQHNRWSIGSHGGIIRPLIVALTAKNSYEGVGIAVDHQNLTHRSQNISSALSQLVPLLFNLINDASPTEALQSTARNISLIKIHGSDLSKKYAAAMGPGNIDKDEMWKIHTEFSHEFLSDILANATDENMITTRFATACYPEHGVPLILYFLYKNNFDFKKSIFDNANAGGDNVHRGMILGALAGASSKEIPEDLKTGLKEYESIKKEIDAFVNIFAT